MNITKMHMLCPLSMIFKNSLIGLLRRPVQAEPFTNAGTRLRTDEIMCSCKEEVRTFTTSTA
eukprot:5566292-Amphidinium_carterae.1